MKAIRATALVFGLLAAVLLGFTATPAFAQSATGTITGQVTDQQNAAIPGADIKMVDPATNSTRTAVTNELGRYTIVNVPPGTYDLTITRPGFTTVKMSAQKVDVGESLTLN